MGVEAGEVSDEDNSAAMELFSAGRSALQQRNFDGTFKKLNAKFIFYFWKKDDIIDFKHFATSLFIFVPYINFFRGHF